MRTFICSVLAVLLISAGPSIAQVPSLIHYQGRLANGTNLVNALTSMVFQLYGTGSGGAPTYVETQQVQIVDGLYSVSLGQSPGLGSLREAISHQPLFIEVRVGGTVLSPREQMGSVPFALMAPGMSWVDVTDTNQQTESGRGYLADSSSCVTLVLPTNPAVGDIVRVAGAGTGGWRIPQNAGQEIMGDELGQGVVEDGWAARTNSGSHSWRNMGLSDDGGRMCAAVYGGYIYTSSDYGMTWTNRASSRNWQGLDCSGDGAVILAGVNGGYLYISYDGGGTWTARMTDASRVWPNTAVSHDGQRMAGVVWGETSGGYIYTSSDSGSNWTARMTDMNRRWNSLACSSNGMTLVAGVYGGYPYVSYDAGTTWSQRTSMGMGEWWGFACSADGMTMLGARNYTNNLILSTDGGNTWSAVPSAGQRTWYDAALSANGQSLAACDSSPAGQVFRSVDSGSTWTSDSPTQDWYGVSSSLDGAYLMAGGGSGPVYVRADSSLVQEPPGTLRGAMSSAIELLYVGNGRWLPLSAIGTTALY